MTKRSWVYYGTVTELHSGDSFSVDLDPGLYLEHKVLPVRIAGISAPALSAPSGAGKAALTFLGTLIEVGDLLRLESVDGKYYGHYGRLLAKPYTTRDPVPMDVAALMLGTGHAVPYTPS